jgi:chromatin segregation and condensation protein Rec8/ScpA/Scc1 (kleisin family)
MSRTEAYEELIEDENNSQETTSEKQVAKKPEPKERRYSTQEEKLRKLVTEFVEAYEEWEVNAYGSGKVVYATRLPNWEALGRKYYDIYLKAKKFTK